MWDILVIAIFMAVAICLLLLETFLLPGITVAGVAGVLFAAGGVVYAYSLSPAAGHVTLSVSAVVFGGFFGWLLRSGSFQRVALRTNIDARLTSTRDLGLKAGDRGITLSRLAPVGKARFGELTVEAKAQENFIDEQMPVTILRIDGSSVTVEALEQITKQ
jgi:hypothetical protein